MAKSSRKEFAEVLYYWVMKDLGEKQIKGTANSLDCEITSDEDHKTIFRELLILNMYLAVRAVENAFEDEAKRNDCLDLLHHIVFDRLYGEAAVDYDGWWKWMGTRYLEYQQALDSTPKHPSGSLWPISKIVSKRLFGEVKNGPFTQASIGEYVGLHSEHLTHLIHECDVE